MCVFACQRKWSATGCFFLVEDGREVGGARTRASSAGKFQGEQTATTPCASRTISPFSTVCTSQGSVGGGLHTWLDARPYLEC